MACQISFCGQDRPMASEEARSQEASWLSDHVTLLAVLQGHPVPLGVMALLGKWLCHIWGRKKAISSPEVITHSVQPFQELPGRQRKTNVGEGTGSWCCYGKGRPPGGRTGTCHSSTVTYHWMTVNWWQVGINIHDPPTKRQRPLHTSREAGRNGNIFTSQHPWVSKAEGATGWYLRAKRSLLGWLASPVRDLRNPIGIFPWGILGLRPKTYHFLITRVDWWK